MAPTWWACAQPHRHRHRRAVPPSSNLPAADACTDAAASHLSQVNTRVVWGVGCCSAARVRPTHLCIFVPRPSSRVGCATDERPPISNSSSRHQSGWELEGNQLVRPCVCVCVCVCVSLLPITQILRCIILLYHSGSVCEFNIQDSVSGAVPNQR